MRYFQIMERGPAPSVQSPAFRRWFGDSKIVDAQGHPLRMYHGTNTAIEVFDIERASKTALYGPGFYFTDSTNVAGGPGPGSTKPDGSLDDQKVHYNAMFNLAGYAFGGVKHAFPELTKRQMSYANRLFGTNTVQRDAYEDIGTRRNYAIGYRAWQAGEPDFREWLANSAPRWFRDKIMKDVQPERITRPQVLAVYLAIRNPFDIRESIDEAALARILHVLTPAEATAMQAKLDGYLQGRAERNNDTLYHALARCGTNPNAEDKERANAVLRRAGFDGIVHEGGKVIGTMGDHLVAVAFSPAQIKSAISNSGAYDPENPHLSEQTSV